MTLLDALVATLAHAADYNRYDQIAPAAILVPDAARDWELLAPRLRECLPLLTLGAYHPTECIGPAVWLRCAHAHVLSEIQFADGTAVIYLPNVSAQELRAVAQYPRTMQPLADLYCRGVVWSQSDGQDWTISAFLETLRVPTRNDDATHKALRRALPRLADIELDELREGAPWKAADLDALLGFKPGPSLRELILQGESATLEFKSTARYDVRLGKQQSEREQDILKAVAAFLNSYEGGVLLIGVTDDGEIYGLTNDYSTMKEQSQRNRDFFEQWLLKKFQNTFGADSMAWIRAAFHQTPKGDVCQVTVLPGHRPVFLQKGNDIKLFVRIGNKSEPLDMQDAVEYSIRRWAKPTINMSQTQNA